MGQRAGASSTRWLVAGAIAASVLVYAGYRILGRTAADPPERPERHFPTSSISPAENFNGDHGAAGGDVIFSTDLVDFGQVPLCFASTRNLFLLNRSGIRVPVEDIRLRRPFGTEASVVPMEPGESLEVAIVFHPEKPGLYEQRLVLALGEPKDAEVEVVVRE